MRPTLQPGWWNAARAGRTLALVLALACQVVAGALGLAAEPQSSAKASLQATMVLCLGGHGPAHDQSPPVHPHVPDQAVAASWQGAAQYAAAPDCAHAPAPVAFSPVFWTSLPQARGPPSRFAEAAYPTGPPARLI